MVNAILSHVTRLKYWRNFQLFALQPLGQYRMIVPFMSFSNMWGSLLWPSHIFLLTTAKWHIYFHKIRVVERRFRHSLSSCPAWASSYRKCEYPVEGPIVLIRYCGFWERPLGQTSLSNEAWAEGDVISCESLLDESMNACTESENGFDTLQDFSKFICIIFDLLSAPTYRLPKKVTEIYAFPTMCSYALCPRCKITLEREYQKFCDRCGQRLDWSKYDEAEIRYIGWDRNDEER